MTFIVEDGTGKLDANALVDVSFVDRYADDMGVTVWGENAALLPPDLLLIRKQRAIVVGSRWLSSAYVWRGTPMNGDQALEWPRTMSQISREYIIPARVKQAVAEAAIRAYSGIVLNPDLERGGEIISEKVGPIAVTYGANAPGGVEYTGIDALVREWSLGSRNTQFINTERV